MTPSPHLPDPRLSPLLPLPTDGALNSASISNASPQGALGGTDGEAAAKENSFNPAVGNIEPQLLVEPAPSKRRSILELINLITLMADEAGVGAAFLKDLERLKEKILSMNQFAREKSAETLKLLREEINAGIWGKIFYWLSKAFAALGAALGTIVAVASGNPVLIAAMVIVCAMVAWDIAAIVGEAATGDDFISLNALCTRLMESAGQSKLDASINGGYMALGLQAFIALTTLGLGLAASASSTVSQLTLVIKKITTVLNLIQIGVTVGQAGLSISTGLLKTEIAKLDSAILQNKGGTDAAHRLFDLAKFSLEEFHKHLRDLVESASRIIEQNYDQKLVVDNIA